MSTLAQQSVLCYFWVNSPENSSITLLWVQFNLSTFETHPGRAIFEQYLTVISSYLISSIWFQCRSIYNLMGSHKQNKQFHPPLLCSYIFQFLIPYQASSGDKLAKIPAKTAPPGVTRLSGITGPFLSTLTGHYPIQLGTNPVG